MGDLVAVEAETRRLAAPREARHEDRQLAPIPPPPRASWARRLIPSWRVGAGIIVVLTLIITLVVSSVQALQASPGFSANAAAAKPGIGRAASDLVHDIANPAASGHGPTTGPWAASAGTITLAIATAKAEPCSDPYMFIPNIQEWSEPPGCYDLVYKIDPSGYPERYGFGWCNWWVREHHLDHLDITEGPYPRGPKPVVGAPVFFNGNVQGADSEGHWAQVVAIAPDNYWILITEMNFAWRGAGWARVDYRYIHVGPGVSFVYV